MSRLIADTNILLRSVIEDDPAQTIKARQLLTSAEQVVVPNIALCEFAWVASRLYRHNKAQIGRSIRLLTAEPRVVIDKPAVEAGLSFLEAGGDFADGIIAFDGQRLGGEVFATFDKKAASILENAGMMVSLL